MHSMTGFGRGSAAAGVWLATVEISSVNRKQAEIVIQSPRELNELEARIRKIVTAIISRGRLQISIHLERSHGNAAEFRLNSALALAFTNVFCELEKTVGHVAMPTAADYLRQPGMILNGSDQMDAESAWIAIEPALAAALVQLSVMRAREGADLKADFISRLDLLSSLAGKIAAEAPGRPLRQRDVLMKRLREAGLQLESPDERVLKEIALFADRCDISEEITRIDSHFAKFREYINAAEPPGRALDFLCQEFFREFNTIGSKAVDASIAQIVVEAKTELEKIREQVQNIE